MRRLLRGVNTVLEIFGLDLRKTARSSRGSPATFADRRDSEGARRLRTAVDFPFADGHPCLGEGPTGSGFASGHYFHQDLLVARRIRLNEPAAHVDVGSRIDGFVAHVASFRPIEVFDIRPLPAGIPERDVRAGGHHGAAARTASSATATRCRACTRSSTSAWAGTASRSTTTGTC